MANNINIRFLKFDTKEIYNAKSAEISSADIAFITDTREIIVNKISYGLPANITSNINDLNTAINVLLQIKHFGGIKIGNTTWLPATDGAALSIAGNGLTTVAVLNNTLTISSPNYKEVASADTTNDGVAKASDVKAYVDNQRLTWIELS